mmetsp:Transcript_11147/g.23942  ORF Transcript_11147/g.23942 Transcript_11147/m.23942 type:complete len:112 (+) Transcript_11147:97-432(+)
MGGSCCCDQGISSSSLLGIKSSILNENGSSTHRIRRQVPRATAQKARHRSKWTDFFPSVNVQFAFACVNFEGNQHSHVACKPKHTQLCFRQLWDSAPLEYLDDLNDMYQRF